MNKIKIFDTTLRDGEQTNHVSFLPSEKLLIAESLINNVGVDYLEIGSCKVSNNEKQAIINIAKYAAENGFGDKISVLSFCDHKKSIDWLLETECKKINLLTKGSKQHCEVQLKKTLQEHIADIEKTLQYARDNNIKYSIYLEDWSRGVEDDFEYVKQLTSFLESQKVESIILCDTMGVLNPWKTGNFATKMKDKFASTNFEFHCHNDYALAIANCLYAVQSGIECIHTTINGLGERAGNTNLIDFAVCLKDHLNIETNINEQELQNISNLVERLSGKRVAHNSPIVGRDVFTQTAGVHADGDKKGNLYRSKLRPERFNRKTEYSLGKMSGGASIDIHLKDMGINVTAEQKALILKKIVEIADAKKTITSHDLPFIISDVIGKTQRMIFEVVECIITSSTTLSPVANVKIRYNGAEYTQSQRGNGGYDAFMNCLREIAKTCELKLLKLVDFEVSIPKGGHTDALVETIILWEGGIKTSGVSPDQIMSSIKATEKMINLIHLSL